MDTPGLNRWSRLQSSPFGRNTATSPDVRGGTTGSQLRRLGEDYNQATRLLRRQARRGDANSALAAIKLREDALAQGIQTGGIRKAEEYNSGILSRVDAMRQGATDRERAAELDALKVEEERRLIEGEDPIQQPEPAATTVPDPRTSTAGLTAGLAGMADRGMGLLNHGSLGAPAPLAPMPGEAQFQQDLVAPGTVGTPATLATRPDPRNRRVQQPGTSREADFVRRPNWWEMYRKTI